MKTEKIKAKKTDVKMKKTAFIIILALLFLAATPASAAADSGTAASHISVVSYETDPGVFMPGDIGTVKITVKNTGTSSVDIKRATLITKEFILQNDQTYAIVGSIGPDVTKEFTFTLKAKGDGIYYPRFYLDFAGGGSLSYPVMVKVQSAPLKLSVINKPDVFQKDVKASIKIVAGNPRENAVSGIIIKPVSDIATFTQTSYFVGELLPNGQSEIIFEAAPESEGEIKFIAEYRNGINSHETEISVPVIFGEDKKSANPVVNNIELTSTMKGYHITGDVTNAGLKNAKSVVVTTDSPAVPIEPNRLYVIGELEPDDFSGFDVDFTADDAESVPLLILYKDEDGNDYTKTIDIKVRDGPSALKDEKNTAGESGDILFIAVIVIFAAAAAGGAIYYSWKKN